MNPTVIKFWLMPNAAFESKQTIDHELELFHQLNPKIRVEYEIFSWSRAWFQLMQAVKQKSGPDVIQVGSTWIRTFAYLGALQKLNESNFTADNFLPFFYDICRCFDHLWAVPWFCDSRVLFYRKDYLEKSGINPSEIQTWDLFLSACAKLSKLHTVTHNISPLGFSSQKDPSILQDIACFLWSHGGCFLSKDGKHSVINEANSKQGINFFLNLISSNHISRTSLEQGVGEVVENFFFHDEYAFLISSSWPLQEYLNPLFKRFVGRNKAKNFGVMLVPSGPAGRFNFAGGSSLAVTSFARHPDESFAFLEFMTAKDSIERYCKNINMLPSRKDITVAFSQIENSREVFSQAVNKFGRTYPPHPLWGSIEQIVVDGLAHSLKEYLEKEYNQNVFFRNISLLNQEIELILSVFGD